MKNRIETMQWVWRVWLATVLLALAGGAHAQRPSLESLQAQINAKIGLSDLAACAANDTVVRVGSVWKCKSTLPRFVDNGDDTVTDNKTGLMWEKKLNCSDPQSNVRCRFRFFQWGTPSSNEPNGDMATVFLPALNGLDAQSSSPGVPCFANYCDWRIPTLAELRSLKLANCTSVCVDPLLNASIVLATPFGCSAFLSSTTNVANSAYAWEVNLCNGRAQISPKGGAVYPSVIAVRGSSS